MNMKSTSSGILLAGVAIAVSSCPSPVRSRPQPVHESASPRGAGASDAASPAGATAASTAGDVSDARTEAPDGEAPAVGLTAPVGTWGIAITVPPSARSEHEAHADRHNVYLSQSVSVTLSRIKVPAPASLAEAAKFWNQDKNSKNLGEGVTPSGVFYGVRTFEVRVGVPSMPGEHLHTWKKVSRVYAVIALEPASHVECTGYVEHGVEAADHPDIQAVRAICLSMRKQ